MSLKNITYLDLIAACQEPGCLVCTLQGNVVAGYIRMLFHEHVNDPPSREKLRRSQGLCYEHIWLAIDTNLGNALGVAIISNDVIGKLLGDLENVDVKTKRFSAIKKFVGGNPNRSNLAPEKRCPVCLHAGEMLERILKTLVEFVQKPELSDAIRNSDGLCLPHLRQALVMSPSPEASHLLLALVLERWERLQSELAEFIRKNDYRFSKEGFGEERDSWLRAVAALTGNRPARGE
jgi:hypothetical protein